MTTSAEPCDQAQTPTTRSGVEVNDQQSQLNRSWVHRIVAPASLEMVADALRDAALEGRAVSIAGGRHSMGGQQFGSGTILLDMTRFNHIVRFDRANGLIEVEAGIQWPELIEYLQQAQLNEAATWGIRQKQTGVDSVTIGGSLASNIHGRGLRMPPIISDVESFVLVDARGEIVVCSRTENAELFSLAIGGYGLFGVIAHVTLRLARRTKVERVVEVIAVKDLLPKVAGRIEQGFLFGDCQYATDLACDAPAHEGLFSCYRPVSGATPVPENQRKLSGKDWASLYALARTDKKQAFAKYFDYYLRTNGQVYWSDTHQLAGSFEGYRDAVDVSRGTEMITEAYVSADAFIPFMARTREDFVQHNVDMTYGTIRFIEKDTESFLAWAREQFVCIVCNLHVRHTPAGRAKAAQDFRRILDRAIEHGGSFYLTYHRWATRRHIETCYPQFADFLRLKKKYDPQERFQSDWYRHHKTLFADVL